MLEKKAKENRRKVANCTVGIKPLLTPTGETVMPWSTAMLFRSRTGSKTLTTHSHFETTLLANLTDDPSG